MDLDRYFENIFNEQTFKIMEKEVIKRHVLFLFKKNIYFSVK